MDVSVRAFIWIAGAAWVASATPYARQQPDPIIDVHLHAMAVDAQGPPPVATCTPVLPVAYDGREAWGAFFTSLLKDPPCADPVWSPATDEALMNETLDILKRRNIIGIVGGDVERVQQWRDAAPDRVIPALGLRLGPASPSPDSIRLLKEQGRIAALAEVAIQYAGIAPDDPEFEPYLAMAEAIDLPIGIHIGTGPPGAPYLGYSRYRARLHSPLLLEEPLRRHPKLRVYIMHAGWPMLDDLLALLWAHPQVYLDVAVIDWALPRPAFHRYLQEIVNAGFGTRVMFGSDQMVWPGTIERALESIESASFLSREQKRDILYRNAARFFRFSDADVAKHHGRIP